MARKGWKLTVRYGSDVSRKSFDTLDEALDAAREAADEVVADGTLDNVKAIRDYGPAQIVNARIEISGKGFFSPPTAGIDIQGDLSVIAYRGGVRRAELKGSTVAQGLKSVRMALANE